MFPSLANYHKLGVACLCVCLTWEIRWNVGRDFECRIECDVEYDGDHLPKTCIRCDTVECRVVVFDSWHKR